MDLTLKQYIDKFKNVINKIRGNNNGVIMAKIGAEATTKIKQRIQNTGTNAKNQKFPAYSTKPMLIGCSSFTDKVCKQIFNSKAKRKALDWRTLGAGEDARRLAILNGGYKEWRRLMGRPTDKVDFTVSGRMWNNINVISNTANHKAGLDIIGAKDDENKKKLAGNTRRKGDILDLSQKEQDELKEDFNLQVLNIFRENGL